MKNQKYILMMLLLCPMMVVSSHNQFSVSYANGKPGARPDASLSLHSQEGYERLYARLLDSNVSSRYHIVPDVNSSGHDTAGGGAVSNSALTDFFADEDITFANWDIQNAAPSASSNQRTATNSTDDCAVDTYIPNQLNQTTVDDQDDFFGDTVNQAAPATEPVTPTTEPATQNNLNMAVYGLDPKSPQYLDRVAIISQHLQRREILPYLNADCKSRYVEVSYDDNGGYKIELVIVHADDSCTSVDF